jgi:hypoxanthine phosphoribosyltransferase
VHEFFLFKGVETYHAAVKATSYRGIEKRIVPEIEGLDSVLSRITKKDRVLILDDIFDSGCTVKAVRDRVMERTRSVKIGTLYLRRGRRVTDVRPDYFLKETDQWVVFPHELMDLSPEEIQAKDGDLYDLVTS